MKLHPFKSAFQMTSYSWKLPRSRAFVPLVNIEGRPSANDHPMLVKFHSELLPYYCTRDVIIADISALKASEELKKDILAELASRYSTVV